MALYTPGPISFRWYQNLLGLSAPGSLPTPPPPSFQHLLQPGPPPHPLLGQRLEPPGKLQKWLMVIAARTGRVAAPPILHRAGVDPEK